MTTETELTTYARLAAEFDHVFTDSRGGFTFDYATGEQVISRLNEVLGYDGWSFQIIGHGIHEEADEAWVLGRLTIFPPVDLTSLASREREQFGSQKIKRPRGGGRPLDIGFDLKGAATDALKKCASLVGVGLYLFRKDEQQAAHRPAADGEPTTAGKRPESAPGASGGASPAPPQAAKIACKECGALLALTRFKDGTAWTPADLANNGVRKHGRPLCLEHYRAANDAARRGAAPAGVGAGSPSSDEGSPPW